MTANPAASTSRGRPRRTGAPDGRSRLLKAARAEFGERGYGATTIDHLVAAAGVNPPTLYHHFGGKSGLFVATARDLYDEVLAELRAAVSESPKADFGAAIDAVFDVAVEIMQRDPAVPKLFLVIQFELPRQPGLPEELHQTLREFRGFFDQIAVQAPPHIAATAEERHHLARALVAIVNGLNGEALLLPQRSDFPALVNRMRALLGAKPHHL